MRTYKSRIFSLLLLSMLTLSFMTSCGKDNRDETEEVTHFYQIEIKDKSQAYNSTHGLDTKVLECIYGVNSTEQIFHGTEAAAIEMFNNKCAYMETADFVQGINIVPDTYCTFNLIQLPTTVGEQPPVITSRTVTFHTNSTGG